MHNRSSINSSNNPATNMAKFYPLEWEWENFNFSTFPNRIWPAPRCYILLNFSSLFLHVHTYKEYIHIYTCISIIIIYVESIKCVVNEINLRITYISRNSFTTYRTSCKFSGESPGWINFSPRLAKIEKVFLPHRQRIIKHSSRCPRSGVSKRIYASKRSSLSSRDRGISLIAPLIARY